MKNTSHNPLIDESDFRHVPEDEQAIGLFGKNYYLTSLMGIAPTTVTIAFDEEFDGLESIKFNFIDDKERLVDGVTVTEDVDLED